MNLSLLHPFRYLYQLFTKDDSPKQLAFGVAIGLMIGLIPKGNLIAVGLTVLMFAFRTNLGAGLLTICGVTSFSSLLDPLLHGIGARVLGNPTIYIRMSNWYELPLMPWTSLNNTVVMGGLILGAALFFPAYHLSEKIFDRHYDKAKASIADLLRRRKPTKLKQSSAPSPPMTTSTPTSTPSNKAETKPVIPKHHLARQDKKRGQTYTPSAPPSAPRAAAIEPGLTDNIPDDVIVDWRRQ